MTSEKDLAGWIKNFADNYLSPKENFISSRQMERLFCKYSGGKGNGFSMKAALCNRNTSAKRAQKAAENIYI